MSEFNEWDGRPPACPADVDLMDWNEAIAWCECWTGADCEDEEFARATLKRILASDPEPRPFIDRLMETYAYE